MPAPQTVLYVQHYTDGGSVTSLLDLVGGLDPARYRPVVCFRERTPFATEFEARGVTVEHLFDRDAPGPGLPDEPGVPPAAPSPAPRRGATLRKEARRLWRRDLPAVRRLVAVARRHRPAIVHANNDVRMNRDALVAATVLRLPVVVHVRWLYDDPPRLTAAIDALAARRVARFLFISAAVRDAYRPVAEPARRGIVLDNPFDVAVYRQQEPPGLRAELGLDSDGPVLVLVGRVRRWKGQDVLVRALAERDHLDRPVQAVFVGAAGDVHGHRYEREVRELAAQLGVAERVHFVGARRDIPALLALADVVVHSSTEPEPFGRVIVEAMAAGRPVVASDAGGVPEIVDHGATGLLVASGDPAALASAIDGLLADPAGAAAMAERARRAAAERFGIERHAAVVQDVYDEVLAARR